MIRKVNINVSDDCRVTVQAVADGDDIPNRVGLHYFISPDRQHLAPAKSVAALEAIRGSIVPASKVSGLLVTDGGEAELRIEPAGHEPLYLVLLLPDGTLDSSSRLAVRQATK